MMLSPRAFALIMFSFSQLGLATAIKVPAPVTQVLDSFDYSSEAYRVNKVHKEGSITTTLNTEDVLFGRGSFQFDYEVVPTDSWGGFVDSRVDLPRPWQCGGASTVSLRYKILKPQSIPKAAHVRFILLDNSECVMEESCDSEENYYAFSYVLDDDSGEWQELRFKLEGSSSSSSPLWRTGWSGIEGNEVLDKNFISGYRLQVNRDGNDNKTATSGSILFDHLTCEGGPELLGAPLQPGLPVTWKDQILHEIWQENDLSVEFWQALINETAQDLQATQNVSGFDSSNHTISWPGSEWVTFQSTGGMIMNWSDAALVQDNLFGSTWSQTLSHKIPAGSYLDLSEATELLLNIQVNEDAGIDTVLRLTIYQASDGIPCFGSLEECANEVLGEETANPVHIDRTGMFEIRWDPLVEFPETDFSRVVGFSFAFAGTIPPKGLWEVSRFVTVPSNATLTSEDSEPEVCTLEPGIGFALLTDAAEKLGARKFVFGGSVCCQLCLEDDECQYAYKDGQVCVTTPVLPDNAVFFEDSDWFNQDLAKDAFTKENNVDFCDACNCVSNLGTIDCSGRNLKAIPGRFDQKGLWDVTRLDLRGNNQLGILGRAALQHFSDTLEEIGLPKALQYVSPDSLVEFPALKKIDVEDDTPLKLAGNAVFDESVPFSDVCCSIGRTTAFKVASASEEEEKNLHFCDYQPFAPGIDSTYYPFVETFAPHHIYLGEDSPFMAEASESQEKCAEYCSITKECEVFLYDRMQPLEKFTCIMMRSGPDDPIRFVDQPDLFAESGNTSLPGLVAGIPPKTRRVMFDARVHFSTQEIEVSEATDYTGTIDVHIGSKPLRGAVWVDFSLASNKSSTLVTVDPQRVVLFEANTSVTVAFRVTNSSLVSSSLTLLFNVDVKACDEAFLETSEGEEEIESILLLITAPDQSDDYNKGFYVGVYGGLGLLFLLALLFAFERRRRHLIEVAAWKIAMKDLIFKDPPEIVGRGSFGMVLKAEYRGTEVAVKRILPPADKTTQKSTSGFDMEKDDNTPGSTPGMSTMITSMKSTKGSSSMSMKNQKRANLQSEFIEEMAHLAKLRHPNVTTVMGAVVEAGADPMLVMEFMDHGSLHDLVHNSTVVLHGESILSILRGITKGMRFLHSGNVLHGDLKAANVLVNSKFQAKVADFGLTHKKRLGAVGTPFFLAPELITHQGANTKATDVYSFAILLNETYARGDPYQGETIDDVLGAVAHPVQQKRPEIPRSCPPTVETLMKSCWAHEPRDRPQFETMDYQLSIWTVDDVEPRHMEISRQFRKERLNRTGTFLNAASFPPHVYRALEKGQKVEPESFESVTVLIAEVANFNRLCMNLSPDKISNLLDRLFDRFSELAKDYGLFEVETVSDSFMVCANLLRRQDDNHALLVAKFAVAIVAEARKIPIDMDDFENGGFVDIRVGFHTGPVVGMVSDVRSPRYSLCGETVKVANRLQTHCLRGRIKCSHESSNLLMVQQQGGEGHADDQQPHAISTMPATLLTIKGQSNLLQTYWVNEGHGWSYKYDYLRKETALNEV